jgi:hypothetical protein
MADTASDRLAEVRALLQAARRLLDEDVSWSEGEDAEHFDMLKALVRYAVHKVEELEELRCDTRYRSRSRTGSR